MINRLAATWGVATAMTFFLLCAAALTFGPSLILKYYPPFVDFETGPITFDENGAMLFTPTFTKVWCDFQKGRESWHAETDGVSERANLSYPEDPKGDPNRPPGKQKAGLWRVDIYAYPDATDHYGQFTHKCLGIFTVITKIGPWPIPKRFQ